MPFTVAICRRLLSVCIVLLASIAAHAIPPAAAAYTNLIFDDEFTSLTLDTLGDGTQPWWDEAGEAFGRCDYMAAREGYIGGGTAPLGVKLHEITPQGTVKLYGRVTPNDKLANVGFFPCVAGFLNTQKSHLFSYGYFEWRARLPLQSGAHFGLWLCGNGNDLNIELFGESRHRCGNVDQMNTVTGNTTPLNSETYAEVRDVDVSQFHTYGILWAADSVRWYLDEVCFNAIPTNLNAGFSGTHTKWICMDNYIGYSVKNHPDSSVVWPYEMEIDYVRVYATP